MKSTLFFGFICLAAIATATALPIQALNPDNQKILVQQNGRRIILEASGLNAPLVAGGFSRDARNFLWAVENLVAGGQILLKKGQYHINKPLIFKGFQGRISGAGCANTELVFRGSTLVNGEYQFPGYTAEQSAAHLAPNWVYGLMFANKPTSDPENWKAVSTNLRMEQIKMTFLGRCARTVFYGLETFAYKGAILMLDSNPNYIRGVHRRVEHMKARFDSVEIVGKVTTDPSLVNLHQGILIYGAETWVPATVLNVTSPAQSANGFLEIDHLPINADVRITNCKVTNTLLQGFGVETPMSQPASLVDNPFIFPTVNPYPKAQVIFENNWLESVAEGLLGEPIATFATFILSPSGVDVVIRNNVFKKIHNRAIALAAGQGESITLFPQEPSQISIEYNKIEMAPCGPTQTNNPGIVIGDLNLAAQPPGYTLFATIQFNEFIALPGFASSLVDHLIGAGAVIMNNVFKGEAKYAVTLGNNMFTLPSGTTYLPALSDYVAFNSYTDFTITDNGAHVILGPGAASNTVQEPGATVVNINGPANTVVV